MDVDKRRTEGAEEYSDGKGYEHKPSNTRRVALSFIHDGIAMEAVQLALSADSTSIKKLGNLRNKKHVQQAVKHRHVNGEE